ncbi:hypothetical protein C8Q76DRAFT_291696 [Earliella scabrosa]|nr:hypothetical protein C8Q76DRAFT_291696 [Earliella scabrosa]
MSSASVRSSLLQEPDYIAAVLEGCCDRLSHSAAATASYRESTLARHAALVLDPLARLLVCEASNQVIALSVLFHPPPEARLHFFVAQNGPLPAIVAEHIRFIWDKISKAYMHVKKRSDDPSKLLLPPFIESTTSDDIEAELLKLEYGLLRHSWKKMYERLVRGDRYSRFVTLANDILDGPEHDRGRLSSDEQDLLEKLKQQVAGDDELRSAVLYIRDTLRRINTILEREPSSGDEVLDRLRRALYVVSLQSEVFAPFAQVFNNYMRLHIASKHVGTEKDDVDVMQWFAKLTYIHTDLYKLVPLLDSYIFTDVLSATVEV